jgi:hypothetical protein
MRTTILLSTLLFLAGSALAQDSPITVGDSSSQQFPPGQKTGRGVHAISLKHQQFKPNGANAYVQDTGYKAACFEMLGGLRPPVSLGQNWTLALSDDVVLTTTDGNRIDIDYKGKQVKKVTTSGGDEHKVVGDQLTWGKLSNNGTTVKRPLGNETPSSPLTFIIHYCPGGTCPSPDPCK